MPYAQVKAVAEAMEKGAGIVNVKVLRTTAAETSRELFIFRNTYLILKVYGDGSKLKNIVKTSVKHNDPYPKWKDEFRVYVQNFSTEDLEILAIYVISVCF